MICPHCKQKISDGSNICPLCFSSLAGVLPEGEEPQEEARASSGAPYTRGSRGRRKTSPATIVAIGIILLLVVFIALIVRSMFSAPTPLAVAPTAAPQPTLAGNFVVFGATAAPPAGPTATPNLAPQPTPEPELPDEETPAPESEYKTLSRGAQGVEVVTLQEALAQLGYLTTASDGIYGTGTATAVRAFQADNGLDADGIAGKQTQAKLFMLSSVTPIPDTTPAPGDILDLPG